MASPPAGASPELKLSKLSSLNCQRLSYQSGNSRALGATSQELGQRPARFFNTGLRSKQCFLSVSKKDKLAHLFEYVKLFYYIKYKVVGVKIHNDDHPSKI